jgi:hypothetical protein
LQCRHGRNAGIASNPPLSASFGIQGAIEKTMCHIFAVKKQHFVYCCRPGKIPADIAAVPASGNYGENSFSVFSITKTEVWNANE